ncbi:MAG: CocE/NonD family hydrolase [Bacteroidota bacterium]
MSKIVYPSIERNGNKISSVLTLAETEPKRKLAIMLHGGPQGNKNGPDNIFIYLSERLAYHGISSIRFDFMGQGDSEGDYVNMTMKEQVRDYQKVLDYIKSEGFRDIGVIGESFGATCILGSLTDDIKTLALLWPAIYLLDETFAVYLTEPYKEELKSKGFIQEGEDRIGPEFLEELVKVDNLEEEVKGIKVPTIFIHGDSDSEVPHTQSIKGYSFVKEPRKIIIVPEGDHCLRKPYEQSVVINEVEAWFSRYL